MKIVKDILYGFIEITPLALKIIDTLEFQRLRFIKQLGLTYFVYPSAQHTRFEHSIGVYHLTNTFLKKLSQQYEIDDRIQEIIAISGLIHDLGHVSFSHTFDEYLIPLFKKYTKHHEQRGIDLFIKMNKKYNLGFSDDEIELMGNIIHGKEDINYPKYIFQIIANKKNELDLDKIDYLMRDGYYLGKQVSFDYKYLFANSKIINNEICFDVKTSFTILSLFNMRYELHKKFYNHKTVILIEVMLTDAFLSVFDKLDLEKTFETDEWLYKLTDNIMFELLNHNESNVIISNIMNRKLYKIVDKFDKQNNKCLLIKKHIGLTSQTKNPILNMNFYNKSDDIVKLDMREISIFELIHSYEIKEFNILRTF